MFYTDMIKKIQELSLNMDDQTKNYEALLIKVDKTRAQSMHDYDIQPTDIKPIERKVDTLVEQCKIELQKVLVSTGNQ